MYTFFLFLVQVESKQISSMFKFSYQNLEFSIFMYREVLEDKDDFLGICKFRSKNGSWNHYCVFNVT